MHITCYTQFLAEANRISDNFHQPWECKLEQTKINWIINELSHGDSCLLTCIFGTWSNDLVNMSSLSAPAPRKY